DVLATYLRWRFVPAPLAIYKGVQKLLPGHVLEWATGAATPRIAPYWQVPNGAVAPQDFSEDEAVDRLEALLRDAVGRRMIADVPIGSFLSGGIDSSLIVALMQAQSARPVRTFSIGFADAGYDEAPHARAVAAHLGTDHIELYVEPADALALVPHLPETYDEPFADASQLPTCLLAKLTRNHVTVALSGDGGDELFAGYRHYSKAERSWRRIHAIPNPLTMFAARHLEQLRRHVERGSNSAFRIRMPSAARLEHWSQILGAQNERAFYYLQRSQWYRPEALVRSSCERVTIPALGLNEDVDFLTKMQLMDFLCYLPDDILTKIDRATMAVALEARVPLLDHRVVQMAMQLPRSLKNRQGRGKWILRQILSRHVPPHLVDRPKSGFSVPMGRWLRGPLRDWAENLLDEQRLQAEGYFCVEPLRERWRQHLAGERDWQAHLWTVLMFQEWQQHQVALPLDVCLTRQAIHA
ncbi:MAG: asparagine synthase C-terminal domain-containing protein, partial [Pseudomonadota bacterium]